MRNQGADPGDVPSTNALVQEAAEWRRYRSMESG